ncbi:hypothetical protein JTB14_037646 [Gonioctena quinquepunctata]|nr:hypothetical protein JTB14_037646 [Gonioctena quinquepunctata]
MFGILEKKSPNENEEEEKVEGMVSLNKMKGTETCIDMPRTEMTTCLLEKPPIDKKVKEAGFAFLLLQTEMVEQKKIDLYHYTT